MSFASHGNEPGTTVIPGGFSSPEVEAAVRAKWRELRARDDARTAEEWLAVLVADDNAKGRAEHEFRPGNPFKTTSVPTESAYRFDWAIHNNWGWDTPGKLRLESWPQLRTLWEAAVGPLTCKD